MSDPRPIVRDAEKYIASTLTRREHLKRRICSARKNLYACMNNLSHGIEHGPELRESDVLVLGASFAALLTLCDLLYGIHDEVSTRGSYEQAEEAFTSALAHIPGDYKPVVLELVRKRPVQKPTDPNPELVSE